MSYIASAIGVPLYMDKASKDCRRIDFAIVCIEIVSTDELLSTIEVEVEEIRTMEVKDEYPWLPEMYSLCKIFGHNDQSCIVQREWRPKVTTHPPSSS